MLTAEYGCDAHTVMSSCYLLCGVTDIIHELNLLSIDYTADWANRPGLTNTRTSSRAPVVCTITRRDPP